MIGLALSGGGVKGSYQIGAYMALKKSGIKISGITGTSIGAFNGAVLACHMENELLKFWKNIDVASLLKFDEKYIKKLKLNEIDLEYFLLKIDNFIDILNNKGVSTEGLQKVLDDLNLEEKLRRSDIEFGLSTFRMKDSKGLDLFLSDIPNGSLNNYILASCYLPIFKQEKLMDNSFFFDGGIHNYCPINMLLKKGYSKVYAIDLKAIGIKQKVIDDSKVIVISPSRKLSNMIDFDRDKIIENIKLGYYDTLKVLNEYDGIKYIFKKKSKKYYEYITSKISNNTYNIASAYFHTSDRKMLVIKSLEYMLKNNNETYCAVYNINKLIKKYKKNNDKSIAYKLIKELRTIF